MDKMESSPKDPKHANNLTTRGNAMLKTFLPDSLKSKAKLPITTKCKEMPKTPSDDNLNVLSEDMKCPSSQQQCPAESKPLARIAMANSMLSKTTVDNEAYLLKRGSSGSSEGGRRRSIPHKITHSASDTACNRGKSAKKPETKKRRSMSDYLDMKSDKHSFTLKEREHLRKKPESKNSFIFLEQKSEQIATHTRKEESNKHQVKNKISLLRGKLPNVTPWTSKPIDTQAADTKQKEGKADDTTKEKGEIQQNVVKTRKTSTDMIKTAFHKKVNTMSGIQSWKLNTFKHKELANDNLSKTEEMLKELMQGSSDTTLENVANDKIDTTKLKSENDKEAVTFDHKKITLSVKKLTPIPSEEYQSDSDVDGTLHIDKETPSSPHFLSSGRGILKKVSNVEIPNLELIHNPEATMKVKEETNNSPSRMVKFDMPSFDSQTSEDLPSITIDLFDIQEGRVEEVPIHEKISLICDKATETEKILDRVEVYNSIEEHIENLENSLSIMKNNQFDKNTIIATLKDVFVILEGLQNHQSGEETKATDSSINSLIIQRNDCLTDLENSIRSIVNINKIMIENKIKPEDIEESQEEEESVEKVQAHTIVLENLDLSTIDTLKDQNGQNIKQSETSEDSLEKNEQTKEFESKVHTKPITSNQCISYNVRKCLSCPELSRAAQNQLSDETFAQMFVQQYQEDEEDVEISEDQLNCDLLSQAGSVDSLQVDMDIIRNCLFIRETQIVDDFVML